MNNLFRKLNANQTEANKILRETLEAIKSLVVVSVSTNKSVEPLGDKLDNIKASLDDGFGDQNVRIGQLERRLEDLTEAFESFKKAS